MFVQKNMIAVIQLFGSVTVSSKSRNLIFDSPSLLAFTIVLFSFRSRSLAIFFCLFVRYGAWLGLSGI